MGIVIAISIMLLWTGHLYYALAYVTVDFASPLFYLHIIVQAYLYTGLFITGHDAMHASISKNKYVNRVFGYSSVFLYAGLWYKQLVKNHHRHHMYPGTDKDPDFYVKSQNFLFWWAIFMFRYLTIIQLVIMAIIFNVLKIWFDTPSIIAFWMIPAILSTLQLFYFGTYLPHRRPHTQEMEPHRARTQKKNHLWAMLSCYFFGYHHEHHESPATPWWQLYKTKNPAPND